MTKGAGGIGLSVARPSQRSAQAAAARALAGGGETPVAAGLVRLSVDIPDELRHRIKVQAARERRSIRDSLIALLEREYPAEGRGG